MSSEQVLKWNTTAYDKIDFDVTEGVVVVVTQVPPRGVDGVDRLGGAGETWLAGMIGQVLNQEPIGVGNALRSLFIEKQRVAGQEDYSERAFEAFRASRGGVEDDQRLDIELRNLAIQRARKYGAAVMGSKIASVIWPKREKLPVEMIGIGVNVDDEVATKRALERRLAKGEMVPGDSLAAQLAYVSQARADRLIAEARNFHTLYPGIFPGPNEYGHNFMRLYGVQAEFDNTPQRTPAEMFQVAVQILVEMRAMPSVAPALVKALANAAGGQFIYRPKQERAGKGWEAYARLEARFQEMLLVEPREFEPSSPAVWEAYLAAADQLGRLGDGMWFHSRQKAELEAFCKWIVSETPYRSSHMGGGWGHDIARLAELTFDVESNRLGPLLDEIPMLNDILRARDAAGEMVRYAREKAAREAKILS